MEHPRYNSRRAARLLIFLIFVMALAMVAVVHQAPADSAATASQPYFIGTATGEVPAFYIDVPKPMQETASETGAILAIVRTASKSLGTSQLHYEILMTKPLGDGRVTVTAKVTPSANAIGIPTTVSSSGSTGPGSGALSIMAFAGTLR